MRRFWIAVRWGRTTIGWWPLDPRRSFREIAPAGEDQACAGLTIGLSVPEQETTE